MPQEVLTTIESQLPLKYWYRQMSEADKLTVEVDVFNALGEVPIEFAMDNVHDQESARSIMGMFRNYIELKNAKADRGELRSEAKAINAYITKIVLPE